jgi:hypothetical protein
LFVVSAIAEGAITLAIVQALEAIQPGLLRRPQAVSGRVTLALVTASVSFAGLGVFLASSSPDGIQKLARDTGITSHVASLLISPLADYRQHVFSSPFLARSIAGLIGLFVVYLLCLAVRRVLTAGRPVLEREGA